MQLEAVTFWHRPAGGGPPLASSAVGPAPLDVPTVHTLVQKLTGYDPASSMNRSALSFPQFGSQDSRENVMRVVANYNGCARCHLSSARGKVVHYRGDHNSSVVFLGEGPGVEEDQMGDPFVGRSGKLQDEMLRQAGIPPELIFYMNVLGCRAGAQMGEDRKPTTPELVACSEHAYLLLQAVRPRVVVCLGKVATRYFFDEPPPVWSFTEFRPAGAPQDWVQVGYAHHPAYLVRVIGAPAMYKEFAAQRTFYNLLAKRIASGLPKVGRWLFMPRYLANVNGPLVAWGTGSSGAEMTAAPEDEGASET